MHEFLIGLTVSGMNSVLWRGPQSLRTVGYPLAIVPLVHKRVHLDRVVCRVPSCARQWVPFLQQSPQHILGWRRLDGGQKASSVLASFLFITKPRCVSTVLSLLLFSMALKVLLEHKDGNKKDTHKKRSQSAPVCRQHVLYVNRKCLTS